MKARHGRIERVTIIEVNSDIQKAIKMLKNGFFLTENNTALEHIEGGYCKISKRVTNYFTKKN